jgi:CubicO group peptidase (beta-lactamase class C family)
LEYARILAEPLRGTLYPSAIATVHPGRSPGRIVYLRAYGDARHEPKVPAEPGIRYAIGSLSMQFTAAAILLLQQDGKREQYQVAVTE